MKVVSKPGERLAIHADFLMNAVPHGSDRFRHPQAAFSDSPSNAAGLHQSTQFAMRAIPDLLRLAPNKNECYAHKHPSRPACQLDPPPHLQKSERCGPVPVCCSWFCSQCRCGKECASPVVVCSSSPYFLTLYHSSQSQPPPRLCFFRTSVVSRSGS